MQKFHDEQNTKTLKKKKMGPAAVLCHLEPSLPEAKGKSVILITSPWVALSLIITQAWEILLWTVRLLVPLLSRRHTLLF